MQLNKQKLIFKKNCLYFFTHQKSNEKASWEQGEENKGTGKG
jgi:hypothetical protein